MNAFAFLVVDKSCQVLPSPLHINTNYYLTAANISLLNGDTAGPK